MQCNIPYNVCILCIQCALCIQCSFVLRSESLLDFNPIRMQVPFSHLPTLSLFSSLKVIVFAVQQQNVKLLISSLKHIPRSMFAMFARNVLVLSHNDFQQLLTYFYVIHRANAF